MLGRQRVISPQGQPNYCPLRRQDGKDLLTIGRYLRRQGARRRRDVGHVGTPAERKAWALGVICRSAVRVSAYLHRAFAVPRERRPRTGRPGRTPRSEEHTSELQSLMRISYAVFCLKKKQ